MICVDSNKHLIEIGSEFNGLRKNAEGRTRLYHFCKLSALDDIFSSKSLLLNNLHNFHNSDDYEKEGIDSKFLGCVFISCFTHCESKNPENLWSYFGAGYKGVKMIFEYEGIFHDVVFDKNKKVRAYSNDKELLDEYGFGVSSVKNSNIFFCENYTTDIKVELLLSDISYPDNKPGSTIEINNDKFLNLSNVSRTVLKKFNDEDETRIVGILRSTKEVCAKDISYLLVPLDFSKFVLHLEFGKKVRPEDRFKYRKLLDNMNNI